MLGFLTYVQVTMVYFQLGVSFQKAIASCYYQTYITSCSVFLLIAYINRFKNNFHRLSTQHNVCEQTLQLLANFVTLIHAPAPGADNGYENNSDYP
jgi:hypothetical protein